jgi:4-hydroxybenzoate polyprenyltransferase
VQTPFLVTGVMFTTIAVAASFGGDGTLWGSVLALGIVFLPLGLALAEDDDRADAEADQRR